MDSSVVTLTEVDVGPLRDTRFAVLVNTSVKEVSVLCIRIRITFITSYCTVHKSKNLRLGSSTFT